MPRVSVEAHGCIVHCTPQQVQTVVVQLLAGGAGPKASLAEADADGVLLHSASAVKACLEASAVLQLKGSATRSFGTAICTAPFRAYLADQQLLGEPLLRVLGWMSAAADAQRHLTLAMVRQAKERFVELMALFPDMAMSTRARAEPLTCMASPPCRMRMSTRCQMPDLVLGVAIRHLPLA